MWAEGPLDVGPGFETQGPTLGGILRSFFAIQAHRAPGALQSRSLFGTDASVCAQHGTQARNVLWQFFAFGHLVVLHIVFITILAIFHAREVPPQMAQNSALDTPSRMLRGAQACVCTMVAT